MIYLAVVVNSDFETAGYCYEIMAVLIPINQFFTNFFFFKLGGGIEEWGKLGLSREKIQESISENEYSKL